MTIQYRRALVWGAVAAALVLPGSAVANEIGGTAFRVEAANVDVGTVTGGKPVTATFVFRNDSDHEVRILKAAPS